MAARYRLAAVLVGVAVIVVLLFLNRYVLERYWMTVVVEDVDDEFVADVDEELLDDGVDRSGASETGVCDTAGATAEGETVAEDDGIDADERETVADERETIADEPGSDVDRVDRGGNDESDPDGG